MMKFLVIANVARHGIPLKRLLPITIAMKKWHEEKIKDGTIECMYNFIEGGGIAVQNHASTEEAYDHLYDYPGYLLFDWEIIPLVDNSKVMDRAISRIEELIAMHKKAGKST